MTGTCKLCLCTADLRKNSHIIPAFLLKYMVGERDNEVSVTIASSGFNDFFIGRNINQEKVEEILIGQEDIIKPNPYAMDYFLCNSCEKYLGVIEGECATLFEKYVDPLIAITDPSEVAFIKYLAISIIWRCSVTSFSKFSLPSTIENRLRELLNNKYTKNSFTDKALQDELLKMPFSIKFRPDFYKDIDTYVFMDKTIQSPYYFLFAEFVCVFYGKPKSVKNPPIKLFGFEKLVDTPLNTRTIEIVDPETWRNCLDQVIKNQAKSSYQFMGDQAAHLFKQLSDKFNTAPATAQEIEAFLKYYVSTDEFKVDKYTATNFLESFKKYVVMRVAALNKN